MKRHNLVSMLVVVTGLMLLTAALQVGNGWSDQYFHQSQAHAHSATQGEPKAAG